MHFYFRHALYGFSNAVLESKHIRGMVVVAGRGRSAKKVLPISFLPQLSKWQVPKPETLYWILRNSDTKRKFKERKGKKKPDTLQTKDIWEKPEMIFIQLANVSFLGEKDSSSPGRSTWVVRADCRPRSSGWEKHRARQLRVSSLPSLFAQTIIPGKLGGSNSDDNEKKILPKWLPEFVVTTGGSLKTQTCL